MKKVWHTFTVEGTQLKEKVEPANQTNSTPQELDHFSPVSSPSPPIESPNLPASTFPVSPVTGDEQISLSPQEPPLPSWFQDDFRYYTNRTL